MKQASGWAVIDSRGSTLLFTVDYKKLDAIAAFMKVVSGTGGNDEWRDWYRRGYRCVRVDVVPKVKGSK